MDTRARTNPFPGLRPFMLEEADLFFGRDKQSNELVRRLASRRFLAAVGASGSGKSSLVRAGLLPSLEGGFMAEAGAHWRMAILRPQDDPIGFLALAIVETGALAHLDLAQSAAEGVVETTLRRSSLGLVEAARLARLEPHENLLILVDQFEELFRFADLAKQRDAGDEAPAFVKLLLAAAQQTEVPVYVVITMRSDFLGDCDRFRGLPEAISDSQYLIPRLTRDELQAAITGPIGVRGGRIAPSLVQRLLNDIGDDMDQLPVLQHALMRAWDHWERNDPDGRPIELSDLEAIGGMAETLSRHADEAFGSLISDRDQKIAERLFKCLTERGPDNREIRRPTQLSRIAAIANADPAEVIRVIDVFRAPGRSFLMPPHGIALESDSVIDISHESLIRQWGRLRTWVEEEAESRATYLRVVDAAQLRRDGKAGLWGEPDLTYARQWQERESPNATWAERYGTGFDDAGVFLRDSEAAHAAELEKERQQVEAERMAKERELEQAKALAEAQRQRADDQAAASIRQRRLIWGLAAILILALGAAGFGWYQRGLAEKGQLAAQKQTTLAEKNASEAAEQRSAADTNRIDAERQKGLAEKSAASAAQQRDQAVAARQEVLKQRGRVQEALRAAIPGQLATRSRAILEGQETGTTDLGLLLTAAAYHLNPRNESYLAMRHAIDATPRLRKVAVLPGPVHAVSPDGRSAVWLTFNEIRLWDTEAGRPRAAAPMKSLAVGILSVTFSPDGRMLASIGADDPEGLRLWDAWTGESRGTVRGGVPDRVAFSPDGRTLAVVAAEAWTARLWDITDRQVRGDPLKGHAGRIQTVVFSPDGTTLATGSDDNTIRMWNAASGSPSGVPLQGHTQTVTSLAFSPDGGTIVSGSADMMLRMWDAATHRPRGDALQGHNGAIRSIAFSLDGRSFVSGSDDGTLRVWDSASGLPRGAPLQGHTSSVLSVAFRPDGKSVVSSSSDRTVRVWDVVTEPTGMLLQGHTGKLGNVAFSRDGETLVASEAGKTVRMWDTATEKLRGGAEAGSLGQVSSVALSPDDKTVAVGNVDGTLRLWNQGTGQSRALRGHEGPVRSVAFSPDGATLVSGGADKTVRLWDVATAQSRRSPLQGHTDTVRSLAFSRDGATLVSGGDDKTVRLWDVGTGQARGESRTGHENIVLSVAFSSDGITVASGSADNTVRLWDAVTMLPRGPVLKGHSSQVESVAFSPDGGTLASGSFDKTVRFWDAATLQPRGAPLKGHEALVLSIAFTRNGKTVVSVDNDGVLRQWKAPGAWIDLVCAKVVRNLSRTEWNQYVGGEIPYVTQCPGLGVSGD